MSATANSAKPAPSSHHTGSTRQRTIASVATTTTMSTRSPTGYERFVITSGNDPDAVSMIRSTVKAENSAPTASEVTTPSSQTDAGTRPWTERASNTSPAYASG